MPQLVRKLYILPYIIVSYGVMMVKIQINLSDEEDKIVEIYKLSNSFKTKEEAIKDMVKFFKVKIRPAFLKEKEYFK